MRIAVCLIDDDEQIFFIKSPLADGLIDCKVPSPIMRELSSTSSLLSISSLVVTDL